MRILLVVYDNGMHINYFPQGLAYIAAVLLEKGYDVSIYNQDLHHYPDEHLTAFLDDHVFDVIGVGIVAGYYQYRKILKISEAINRSKNRPYYIMGGHGPTPEPEFFLKRTSADAVVMGEGEAVIVELLNALETRRPLSEVKGIAYRDGEIVTINERYPLIADVDSIPFPAYHLFPIHYYRLFRSPHMTNSDYTMPLLSGRGCPFSCTFCYRMDEGCRPRHPESITEEILFLKKNYGITYITFSDELLMSSIKQTEDICKAFIKAKLNVKWYCSGRLNFVKADLLRLMKSAGCVFVNYGIEALDNTVLKNMRKGLTVDMIIRGVEETISVGLSPGLNVIFGNIGDNIDTLKKGTDFLLKYDDGSQMRTIRPVTPFPGSPLYYYAIEKGLLKGVEDFYENRHVNSDLLTVNFTELSDEEFHEGLYKANAKLISAYFEKKVADLHQQAAKLYLDGNVDFRGFRQT